MEHRLHQLRGTAEFAGATPDRGTLLAHKLRATHRATCRHHPRQRLRGPLFQHHLHYFRDHVTGTAHDHGVTVAHVQACDVVGVVQGGTGDGDAAHMHRLHQRPRRDRTGATDVDLDRFHHRGLLLGRELVRDGPARRPRDEAHLALAGVVVQLVDHAIDIERQAVACFADAPVVSQQSVDPVRHGGQLADRESPIAQSRQGGGVRVGQRPAFDLAHAVGVEAERALRGERRVHLAQRAGRAVARIGQHLAAVFARLRVVAFEVGTAHIDLAAHFQHRWPAAAGQLLRNHRDGAQVGGHVLAGGAVTAGRALHEHAVLVAQADRQAIQLGFGRKHQVVAIQPLADAADEIAHLVIAEGIAQRQHRHRMDDRREAPGRRRTHLAGRRIGAGQLGMRAFQRFQLPHQRVVLRVGDVGIIQLVVAPVGVLDAAAKVGDAICWIGAHRLTMSGASRVRATHAGQVTSAWTCPAAAPNSAGRRHAAHHGCAARADAPAHCVPRPAQHRPAGRPCVARPAPWFPRH